MAIGIYQIRNKINGKVYIGSTVSKGGFQARWAHHLSDLRCHRHHSQHLQRAWTKYKFKAFVFEIIEEFERPIGLIDQEWIFWYLAREQHYLDTVLLARSKNKALFHQYGYNVSRIAGKSTMLGRRHTAETKAKISKAAMGHKRNLGYQFTEEAKAKIGKANRGEKCGSARLTELDVLKIRALYITRQWTQQALAETYNVARSTIADIVTRKTWKHI